MPPRDNNDRLFHRAVDNIRFALPDGVELNLGEVENVTFEGSADTPDGSFPIRLNPSEAITGTLEVDTPIDREALMRAIADVNPTPTNPPPGYGDFVEVRAPIMHAEPSVNRNGSAIDRALHNISERIRESGIVEQMRHAYTVPPNLYAQFNDFESSERLSRLEESAFSAANAFASAGTAASLFSEWLDKLNVTWANIGDDYELRDESAYVDTDSISFDELMDFGGESK